MAKSLWTVAPETERVNLEYNGTAFWIELKQELTIGEQRRMETAGFRGARTGTSVPEGDNEISIDWRAQSFARTEIYLVDWSLADDAGNKLKLTKDTIQALRQDVYDLIEKAINAHVEARAAVKKADAGNSTPNPT